MLIRFAAETDLPAWQALAREVSAVFQHPGDMGADPGFIAYAQRKVQSLEALTAVDYRSGRNMGFIAFSRIKGCISWFAVAKAWRHQGAGQRLLKTALRQLDTTEDVSVVTFVAGDPAGAQVRALYEKFGFSEQEVIDHRGLPRSLMVRPGSANQRGGSFHFRYPEFIKAADPAFCPVCQAQPAPLGESEIEVNEQVWICGEYPGQGRLFGKLYVMPRRHFVHFEDMPASEMAGFMSQVQRAGAALRQVSGAVKINYEMHANSSAHLHIHLFPRYLDDDFPSGPIDYRQTEPAPYESYAEYLWFIKQMRWALRNSQAQQPE